MGGGKGARERAGGRTMKKCTVESADLQKIPRPPRARVRVYLGRFVVRRRFLARLPTQSVSGLAAEERNVIRSPSCEVDANPVGGGLLEVGRERKDQKAMTACPVS